MARDAVAPRLARPFALLLLILLPTGAVRAADLHVDPTAPDGGDGSAERPFDRIALALDVARPGDRVLLAEGVYTDTVALVANGRSRRAVLELVEGVEVVGAGRGRTVLRAPTDAPVPVFGITAAGVSRAAIVRDLTVDGPCFQGVNLRDADPTFRRVDILSDVTGGSSVAFDARDGSDPLCEEVVFDGGHSALFVEFGSSGTYRDCRIGVRPNEAMSFSDADPVLERCVIEGAGRDVLVLNQGSQPVLRDCRFLAPGGRWTVRVAVGYSPGSRIDLSGNRWYTDELLVLEADVLDVHDDPGLGLRVDLTPLGTPVSVEGGSWGGLKADFLSAPE